MNRSNAQKLLNEYVKNENLKKHIYAVEAAMREYAKIFKKDIEWWGIVGLLHDFDYEKFPDPKDHPYKGAQILKDKGYPDDLIQTVIAHAAHTNTPRDTLAKKAIFSVDELTGLIVATALVKPNKLLSEVSIKSIKKKMKDKAFARQINREEIKQGALEMNVSLDAHIDTVLRAMQSISPQLGL